MFVPAHASREKGMSWTKRRRTPWPRRRRAPRAERAGADARAVPPAARHVPPPVRDPPPPRTQGSQPAAGWHPQPAQYPHTLLPRQRSLSWSRGDDHLCPMVGEISPHTSPISPSTPVIEICDPAIGGDGGGATLVCCSRSNVTHDTIRFTTKG